MDAKPCGLIAVIPPALQEEWAINLTEFARRFRPAALVFKDSDPAILAQAIAGAKQLDLAVLIMDSAGQAAAAGASGVYFSMANADIAAARALLGSAAVIGAACGLSRHDAMEAAEAGADFVAWDASEPAALDRSVELCAWWDELTGVPAALSLGCFRPAGSVLQKARPDFLMVEERSRAGESLTFATEFGLQSQA